MERRIRKQLVAAGVAGAALAGVAVCRRQTALADLYATAVYPRLSGAVSRLSALVPFSLEEILAVAAAVAVIACLARLRRRWLPLLNIILWVVVWFYACWGLNYFRSSIFDRAGVRPATFETDRFEAFLKDYAKGLNDSYVPVESIDTAALEREVKAFYDALPERWGLARPKAWQRPKHLLFNRLYSAVSVMGFVGPFFNEIQIGSDVLPLQYPFVYAHELSHLLGVSSEAEANYWAWKACTASASPAFRYAGYQALMPYVLSNAARVLPEEAYAAWAAGLRPEVVEAYRDEQAHWDALYSPVVGRIQHWIYNLYLKGNRISSGTANYNEVISIILSLDS